MAKSLRDVFNSRKQILEGIKNSLFTKDDVEEVAQERLSICEQCPKIDMVGKSCFVPGTQPCCSECGCKLKWKARALSEECPHPDGPKWHAILAPEEEEELNKQLGIKDEE